MTLAAVELRQRKLENARASIGRALPIFQAAYGPGRRNLAKALVNLGIVKRRKIITTYLISLILISGRARPNPDSRQFGPDSDHLPK